MSHKVDIVEVTDFSDTLEEASSDLQSSLDKVQKRVEAVNNMESFTGKAANEAKSYFNELHLTLLESFRGLFDDLDENLKQHLKAFGTEVDANESAIIESTYLQDVKEDINEVFEKILELDEAIHDTISEVSDISSATSPDFSDVQEWKKKSIKQLKEVDEDLDEFTGKSNEVDVESIMHQIETVMSKARTSKGKARFAEFPGASKISELSELMAYNEDKKLERDNELEKANNAKNSVLKENIEPSSKKIVNRAYSDFKNGDITYDQYMIVLESANELPYIEEPGEFYDEIIKDFITNVRDTSISDGVGTGLESGGIMAEKIIREITYHAATWGPNTKNNFVMYSKDTAEKTSKYIKVADTVSKVGRYGIPVIGGLIDFGLQKTQGEDTGDAAIKATAHVGIGFAGAAAGASIGSIIPIGGTIVGGAIGFAAGVVISAVGISLFDTIYDNREHIYNTVTDIGDNIKETVEKGVEEVGNAVSSFLNGLGTVFG